MFVGTGQNALSGTALLQRLQGRFPLSVELQDTDAEQVTREVVLKKKPSMEQGLRALLEAHSGEIERHLSATKIAFTSRDRHLSGAGLPAPAGAAALLGAGPACGGQGGDRRATAHSTVDRL